MSYELPAQFKSLAKEYPDVCEAFQMLGTQCHNAGPLDEKERKIAKLGIAIGTGSEGAVHSAVRNALQADVSKEAIMHVGILAITTTGLPNATAAMTWIKDIFDKS
ncbi:MAG: carboxymuconolactone decarboxylase family protein [Candidatus Brocadiales bacterium]|nr:carboxymuconolactone decarboxylase family protein [Candidatus Brocadiales bacterium]